MPDTITFTLQPPDLIDRLANAPRLVFEAIAKEMDVQNQFTVAHIIATRMTGKGPFAPAEGRLGVRTGRLRQSLRATPARVLGNRVESAIGSNVRYAGIHEFGGTIPAHTIRARFAKALRFSVGGNVFFRKSVNIPAQQVPARQPIYRGILDRADAIAGGISRAIIRALAGPSPNTP